MTLLGTHTVRMISATGTPFNNKMADLAALCAFYDVRLANKQNRVTWWEMAYGGKDVLRSLVGSNPIPSCSTL